MATPYFLDLLNLAFSERKKKNPRYSIRAFARVIGADHGIISGILKGNRLPSEEVTEQLIRFFEFGPEQALAFRRSIEEERRRLHLTRVKSRFESRVRPEPVSTLELSSEEFASIAPWYFTAICELTQTDGFVSDADWIAKQLGISKPLVESAVQRLVHLRILERNQGRIRKSTAQVVTRDREKTTPALREHQRQMLKLSCAALEAMPISNRDHTSMTMAIDPSKLKEAKHMIADFKRSLCALLESGNRTEVFELQIGLFSLQDRSLDSARRMDS